MDRYAGHEHNSTFRKITCNCWKIVPTSTDPQPFASYGDSSALVSNDAHEIVGQIHSALDNGLHLPAVFMPHPIRFWRKPLVCWGQTAGFRYLLVQRALAIPVSRTTVSLVLFHDICTSSLSKDQKSKRALIEWKISSISRRPIYRGLFRPVSYHHHVVQRGTLDFEPEV